MLPSPSKPEELLRMNESIHGQRTASELQDRVTELIEQQTAISEVLRAIASSPHDLQPIFDAILDSATRLCRADIGTLRLSEEGGLRRVACEGTPFWSVGQGHQSHCSQKRGAFQLDGPQADCPNTSPT